MDSAERFKLWDDFLQAWPVDRIRQMTLEEYTNPNREDSFIYWLEIRLGDLGSIWGGSAFKFGIYHRASAERKESIGKRMYKGAYGWHSKYGPTEQAAFQAIRAKIIDVIDAIANENLDRIQQIDFSPVVKWKIAFLYQSREKLRIFPIYKHECLFYHYKLINPSAKPRNTPNSLMYPALMDQHRSLGGDVFQIAEILWRQWEESQKCYWAISLDWLFTDKEQIEAFLGKEEITSDDVPSSLDRALSEAEVSAGDEIAFLVDADIRALAVISNAEPGEYSWTQKQVLFPCELAVIPTAEIKELDAAEQKAIWGKIGGNLPATPEKSKSDERSAHETKAGPCTPRNIILYGPPGTGKTYNTTRRALELILGEDAVASMTSDTRIRQFRQLQQEGRIEFVTFHQAYGYEEFVEGIRPRLGSGDAQGIDYDLHDGIFKKIALRAASAGLGGKRQAPDFDALWIRLLKELGDEDGRVVSSITNKTYVAKIAGQDRIEIRPCSVDEEGNPTEIARIRMITSKEKTRLLWDHRFEIGPEPGKITWPKSKNLVAQIFGGTGEHLYTPIWIAYQEIYKLSRTWSSVPTDPNDSIRRAQIVLDKQSPGLVDFTFSAASPQFVLIIDEINRGNMSKILGEMITLLEPDKRLGMPGELKLPLAYSPEHRFSVPPNLHIIGTMNTADRSIALMDVAMRRRFDFEELMPEEVVIREALEKEGVQIPIIELVLDIFNTLNSRIRFLYDRDHQLGHAYFLNATGLPNLRKIFTDRVIPLLQEYFYGAWDKICMVLGCPYDDSGHPNRTGAFVKNGAYVSPLITAKPLNEAQTFGFDHEEYEDRIDYLLNPEFGKHNQKPESLIPFFLEVLDLDASAYEDRKVALEALLQKTTDLEMSAR
jgi:5-methylcytosine-specific restriction enzyme B